MPAIDPRSNTTLPLFPPTSDWRPPKEAPNILGIKRLGLDTETKDPGLRTFGAGFMHGNAEMIGASISTGDASWYFPIRHPEDNCDWDVIAFLKDIAKQPDMTYVGANLPYDVEALDHDGIRLSGRWLDVQIAEPLLDEERKGGYALDVLAKDYLADQKDETMLKAAAAAFGIDPKAEMYKLPARFVGPYAEHDANLPLKILDLQMARLEGDGLMPVFEMETDLLNVVYAMRRQGVRIDLDMVHALGIAWKARENTLMGQIKEGLGGLQVDIWSPKQLAQLCNKWEIGYDFTEKGNPSFGNDWLTGHAHPVLNLIGEARKVNKMRRDFIDGSLLKYQINGRLHAAFHTLRGDEDGTRSGRFSSSQPNLQQIPARDPYYGPAIRACFLPDEGEQWYSGDFKSQEPRLLVHFASVINAPGAQELVDAYLANPLLDMHMWTAELCNVIKRHAKTINLGMTYGMGIPKLAAELGMSVAEAEPLFEKYHQKMRFVQYTANMAKKVAERKGYVRTILGRRRHFKIENGRRQFTHKALNSSIQGSGADMMKKAMLDVYKALGIVPLLTVHDELNISLRDMSLAPQITELLEQAIPLRVPNKVDVGIGKNWSEAH